MKFSEVEVTPAMAAKWLTRNSSNRGLSPGRVSAYARDMNDGNWQLTPQPIIFNASGDLLDGQHRLSAVIECGKTIRMLVVKGCDHDIRKHIDRGRTRTLSDRLKMDGVESRVSLKAAISRALVFMDRGGPHPFVTDDEATAAMEKHARGFSWMEGATLSVGYHRAAYLASIIWSFPLGARVTDFHEGVQSGVGLTASSPELAMRRVLLGMRGGGGGQVETILKTCNCIHAAIEDRKLTKVYASSNGYRALAKSMRRRLPDEGSLLVVSS